MECSVPRRQLLTGFVIGLIVSGVSLAGLAAPWEVVRVIALLFLAICGIGSLVLAHRLWVGGADLILNDKGILDRRTGLCVRWSEIRSLSVFNAEFHGHRVQYLAIEVLDPDKHLGGLNMVGAKINQMAGIPPLHIEFRQLWPGIHDVCDYIQRQHGIVVQNWQNPATTPGDYVQPRPDPSRRFQ